MPLRGTRYVFPDLNTLMGKTSLARSGDEFAGFAAKSGAERVARNARSPTCGRWALSRRGRVSQIETKALRKLKDPSRSRTLRSFLDN